MNKKLHRNDATKRAGQQIKKQLGVARKKLTQSKNLARLTIKNHELKTKLEQDYQKLGKQVFAVSKRAKNHKVHPDFERFLNIKKQIVDLYAVEEKFQTNKQKVAQEKLKLKGAI